MNPVVRFLKPYIGRRDRPYDPPFTRWLDGVLTEVEEGEVTMEFMVREEMANPVGLLHGGVENAIIDDAIGIAVLTLGQRTFFMSVNLAVDYLGRAEVGETVIARARVLRRGRRVLNAQCELVNGDGAVIARGTSNLVRSKLPAFPQLYGDG